MFRPYHGPVSTSSMILLLKMQRLIRIAVRLVHQIDQRWDGSVRQHQILRQESLGVIVPASSAERTKCTGRHLHIQTKPLSHRVGHMPEQYRRSAHEPCGQALLRSRLNCRKHNWTAPVELTAVQPSPWLYRESTAPLNKQHR